MKISNRNSLLTALNAPVIQPGRMRARLARRWWFKSIQAYQFTFLFEMTRHDVKRLCSEVVYRWRLLPNTIVGNTESCPISLESLRNLRRELALRHADFLAYMTDHEREQFFTGLFTEHR